MMKDRNAMPTANIHYFFDMLDAHRVPQKDGILLNGSAHTGYV